MTTREQVEQEIVVWLREIKRSWAKPAELADDITRGAHRTEPQPKKTYRHEIDPEATARATKAAGELDLQYRTVPVEPQPEGGTPKKATLRETIATALGHTSSIDYTNEELADRVISVFAQQHASVPEGEK